MSGKAVSCELAWAAAHHGDDGDHMLVHCVELQWGRGHGHCQLVAACNRKQGRFHFCYPPFHFLQSTPVS